MARRKKQRDELFKKIVWVCVLLVVIYLALSLRESAQESTVKSGNVVTKQSATVPANGFEPFEVASLGITFQFPQQQAPLKAAHETTNAVELFKSRDFHIGFYDGPGFAFQPWSDINNFSSCTYDGALHRFQSNQDIDCRFDLYTSNNRQVLIKSFTNDETTRHVTVIPVNNKRHFLVIYNSYKWDCDNRQPVCDVRSQQKKDKLIVFTNALIEKNHNLFAQ